MTTNTMQYLNKITSSKLTLGKAIRTIRLCEAIQQNDFAKQLHISQSYLSDLERDCKEVSPSKAAEFARLLGQSEKQFIRLAIQDALARSGLHYEIDVRDTA